MLKHPPNSIDLGRRDSYLCPKLKTALKEIHFQFVEEIKAKTAKLLEMVTSDEEYHYFEQRKACSSKKTFFKH